MWYKQAKVHDLFGVTLQDELLDKEEKAADVSEMELLKKQFMVTDSIGIISNLMTIIDLKPQYFRLFTIQ